MQASYRVRSVASAALLSPCKLLSLFLLPVLAGCSSTFKLMPAPAYVDTDAYEAAARSVYARDETPGSIRLFYATDRVAPDTPGGCDYSRQRGDRLRLGSVDVAIGNGQWSAMELHENIRAGGELDMSCVATEEYGALYSTLPPTEQAGVDAYYSTDMDDPVRAASKTFAQKINEQMARSGLSEVTVFVSGLSTTFEVSVEQATGLHEFTLRQGAMIAFPWPVGDTPLSASKDRISGRVSARSLRNLLLFLAEHTDAERINMIGYSGGADVTAYALYQLRLSYAGQPVTRMRDDLRLSNVILASPDADYMEFRNMLLDGLLDIADSFTVYVNPNDRVLVFSDKLSAGAPRLGNPKGVTELEKQIYRDTERIHFVSPEEGERVLGAVDPLGHSYWYLNPWVSSDVLLRLTTELAPAERGLVRQEDRAVWDFPEDYPARAEAIAQRFLERAYSGGDGDAVSD